MKFKIYVENSEEPDHTPNARNSPGQVSTFSQFHILFIIFEHKYLFSSIYTYSIVYVVQHEFDTQQKQCRLFFFFFFILFFFLLLLLSQLTCRILRFIHIYSYTIVIPHDNKLVCNQMGIYLICYVIIVNGKRLLL